MNMRYAVQLTSNGMWRYDNRTVNWQRLLQYGPVKIYRLEGETK